MKSSLLSKLNFGVAALFYLPIVVRAISRLARSPEVAGWRYVGHRQGENLVVIIRVYELDQLTGLRARVFWSVHTIVGLTLCVASTTVGIIALLRHG